MVITIIRVSPLIDSWQKRWGWGFRDDLFSYIVYILFHLFEHLFKVVDQVKYHARHVADLQELASL